MNNNNMEIERKFLTESIPFDVEKYPVIYITQIYISTDPTIRIRKYNDSFILTVKGKGEIAKQEFELEITEDQFNNLSQKAETLPLSKKRYLVPIQDSLTAEVDIYEGNCEGLITTEVEFSSLDAAISFNPPHWFGQDVTADVRYKNTTLSKFGKPDRLP